MGDSPAVVLADGRFLLGSFNGSATFLRDPATGNWTQRSERRARRQRFGRDMGADRHTWQQGHPGEISAPNAEKYVVSGDKWQADGATASNLVETVVSEIREGLILTDRTRLLRRRNERRSALSAWRDQYGRPGTWTTGPQIPNSKPSATGSEGRPRHVASERERAVPRRAGETAWEKKNSPCHFLATRRVRTSTASATRRTRTARPMSDEC